VEVVFGFTSQNYGSVGTLLSTKNAGVKGNQITQPMLYWWEKRNVKQPKRVSFFVNVATLIFQKCTPIMETDLLNAIIEFRFIKALGQRHQRIWHWFVPIAIGCCIEKRGLEPI